MVQNMRKKDIPGILNDLLNYLDYQSPITHYFVESPIKVNLLTGELSREEEDRDSYNFYKNKIKWFQERIEKLKGNLSDFEFAELTDFGHSEEIKIIYKGKLFEKKFVGNGVDLKFGENK